MAERDWFEEAFAPVAVEESPAAEPVIETAAPGIDAAPPLAHVESPSVLTPPSTPDASVAPAALAPEPATGPNWESPDNPLYEEAMLARRLKQAAGQAAVQRQQSEFQQKLHELSDGDSERLTQLNSLIAAQAAPLSQQVQAYEHRANGSEKSLAALWIAMNAHLSEDQIKSLTSEADELMAFDDPGVMEKTAFGKRDFKRQYDSTLSAKDAEILALKQQLASHGQLASREASGADLVDGGGGAPPDMSRDDRLRSAPDMDTFMELQFGGRP